MSGGMSARFGTFEGFTPIIAFRGVGGYATAKSGAFSGSIANGAVHTDPAIRAYRDVLTVSVYSDACISDFST